MDGAGRLQKFLYITLPSLKPMIFFAVTLSVIGGLQLFEEPFILTGGRGDSDQAGMSYTYENGGPRHAMQIGENLLTRAARYRWAWCPEATQHRH